MTKKTQIIEDLIAASFEEDVKKIANKFISEDDVEKACKQVLSKQRMQAKLIEFIENEFTSFFDEDYFSEIISNDREKYDKIVKNIFDEILQEKAVKALISKSIKEDYLNNLSDNCVFEDMMENLFSKYEFILVPKKGI